MSAAVVTGAFGMTGMGAYYLLTHTHVDMAKVFLRVGIIAGLIASAFQIYPSGDMEGRQVTNYQPAKLAGMEGLFQTQQGAGIVILGQPNTDNGTLDNPIIVPNVLSFLTYRHWTAQVLGSRCLPERSTTGLYCTPVLLLSYHGRVRDHLCRDHGSRTAATLAQQAL